MDKYLEKIIPSFLITLAIVFITLFVMNYIFQAILGDFGLYVSMFTSIIFTLVYCTISIKTKLDDIINK